jgi:hypothetical protein
VLPPEVRAVLTASAPAAEQARPPASPTDPSAEPEYIRLEPDPARKARLRKMHDLTTSTLAMVRLDKKRQRLARELSAARQSGAWSAQQLQREEQRLAALEREAALVKKKVEELIEVVKTYAVHIPAVYEENDEPRQHSGTGSTAAPAPR